MGCVVHRRSCNSPSQLGEAGMISLKAIDLYKVVLLLVQWSQNWTCGPQVDSTVPDPCGCLSPISIPSAHIGSPNPTTHTLWWSFSTPKQLHQHSKEAKCAKTWPISTRPPICPAHGSCHLHAARQSEPCFTGPRVHKIQCFWWHYIHGSSIMYVEICWDQEVFQEEKNL